jgi:hypothetical protein
MPENDSHLRHATTHPSQVMVRYGLRRPSGLVNPTRRIADRCIRGDIEARTRVRRLEPKALPWVVIAEKAVSPTDRLAGRSSAVCVPRRAQVNTVVQTDCWRVDYIASPTVGDGLAAYLAEYKLCRAELGGVDGVV